MDINNLKQIFEVEVLELDSWVKRAYKNNFFEIIYIESGSGSQCINYNEFEYRAGNIFLLPPLNCHSFKIKESTKCYVIRFCDLYFRNDNNSADYNKWFEDISYILANYNRVPGDIIDSQQERQYIKSSIISIYREYFDSDKYSKGIILANVSSILNILARNIELRFADCISHNDSRFSAIIRYIGTHLMDNERLKIDAVADKFGISKGYFSDYFKKHAGINFGEYIVRAKLRLAETYILHSDKSLKEIAYALNFSDSSHLSNSFKKYYGITVGKFKQLGGQMERVLC
ncbi:MAG: AraC family transcriptional regulator [Rikenellaceae bacterium]